MVPVCAAPGRRIALFCVEDLLKRVAAPLVEPVETSGYGFVSS